MRRPIKLDFRPLSPEETAKELGIPRSRALQIMKMFGGAPSTLNGARRTRSKARTSRALLRTAKASR